MSDALITGFLFAFGLLFGSFLNVVIHRLPRAESETSTWWVGYGSLLNPRRSQCPHCGHAITWYENVPVFSWLALRGKCAECKKPISPRYVVVELLTGLLFVACFVRFGLGYQLAPALVMVVLTVPLIFIDAEHWILPFELTLPGMLLGPLLTIPLGWEAVQGSLFGVVGGFLAFRVMEYLGWLFARREALGNGDKYLLAMLGGFLGWRPLVAVVVLSSLQGAVYGGLNLLFRGRAGPETPADPGAPTTSGEPAEPPAEEEEAFTFTPAFLRPGLSFGRRLSLIPYTLLFQPIPDDPELVEGPDGEGEVPEWTPGATSLPFGPWIGLSGLEVLLLTPWLHAKLAGTPLGLTMRLIFGPPS